jgi:glycosyltransferase involved in cell wall biosynthesis
LKLFRQVVNKEQPQLFIAHLARMASFLEKAHLEDRSIIEMTDALSKTYALSAGAKGSWLKRLIYSIEKTLIKQHESHIVNRFPKVVLVSQADIDYLRQNANGNGASLHLHTNGVVCQPNPHTTYNPNKICFVGNMRTLQNQDAVLHFVNNIFPIILKQQPHARFYIVGAQPPRHIQELDNQQNVFVTGFVDNLAAAIGDSCIAVAPVNVAAGIQNKVLVAMGTRLPVVLTPLIAQAIPELQDGENCLIRNEVRDFAQACLQLMTNSNLRQSMAREGYNMVSHHYSWNSMLAGYEDFR